MRLLYYMAYWWPQLNVFAILSLLSYETYVCFSYGIFAMESQLFLLRRTFITSATHSTIKSRFIPLYDRVCLCYIHFCSLDSLPLLCNTHCFYNMRYLLPLLHVISLSLLFDHDVFYSKIIFLSTIYNFVAFTI